MRLPLRLLSKAETVVAFAVLLGLVVALQMAGGAYASGFGGYPDEPAHVVTSLMVRDFIAGLDFRHPLLLARRRSARNFHYAGGTLTSGCVTAIELETFRRED